MGGVTPEEMTSVDRNSIGGEPKRIGHRRIIGLRAMVLELREHRELAGGGRQSVGTVKDPGGPDLLPAAKYGNYLRLEVDADPDASLGHASLVPAIVAIVHPARHREDR